MTSNMPIKRTGSRENGKKPVHGERLDAQCVGRNPIHKVADLLPAVEGQREALNMAIEVATKIADHALADSNMSCNR
jgi:hypothetical protein